MQANEWHLRHGARELEPTVTMSTSRHCEIMALRQKIEESDIDYGGTSETGLDEVLRVGFLIQREPSES